MVHETDIIIERGRHVTARRTYLRIELIDLLNGCLNLPGMNGILDLDSCSHGLIIASTLPDVRFQRKLLRRVWISLLDEVVHDNAINIPSQHVSRTVAVCRIDESVVRVWID